MRILFLLVLVTSIRAAQIETVTMNDGRVLLGELTQNGRHTANLALVDPKGMIIQISLDDVKERAVADAATIAAAQEAAKPKRKPIADAAQGSSQDVPAAIATYQQRQIAYFAAQRALEDARKSMDETRAMAVATFLDQVDSAPIKLVITEQSTFEETKRAESIQNFNRQLAKVLSDYGNLKRSGQINPETMADVMREVPLGDLIRLKHDRLAEYFVKDPIASH